MEIGMALEVKRTRSKDASNGTVVSFPKKRGTGEGVVDGQRTSLRWDKQHPLLENQRQIAEIVLGRGDNTNGRRFGKAGFFGINDENDAAVED